MHSLRYIPPIVFALSLLIPSSALAHTEVAAAQEMAHAANAFLATLKPEQKAKATFPLDDADRTRWHFVPTEMHPRQGLSFRDMTTEQQQMAYSLLASVLSARGIQKTVQIMSHEQILHDANTAALGEALAGAGQGLSPVFYVTLGSGIGGGLVFDGKIYHGHSLAEAEIGHVRLGPAGETLESRCSGWAVDRRLRDHAAANPGSPLAKRLDCEGGEARHLAKAMADGDTRVIAIFDQTCAELALGLSHVVHLVNPAVIILGGGLTLVGKPLRAGVAAALGQGIMDVLQPGPSVRLAQLGEDAVPVGALLLALNAD